MITVITGKIGSGKTLFLESMNIPQTGAYEEWDTAHNHIPALEDFERGVDYFVVIQNHQAALDYKPDVLVECFRVNSFFGRKSRFEVRTSVRNPITGDFKEIGYQKMQYWTETLPIHPSPID